MWKEEFVKLSGFKLFTQALHNLMFEIGMLLAVVGKTCAAFPQRNIQDGVSIRGAQNYVKRNFMGDIYFLEL